MNAKEFISLMREETQGNTDIAADIWHLMRQVADHYDQCQDCRDAFDDMAYDDMTLLDLADMMVEYGDIEDWTCQ